MASRLTLTSLLLAAALLSLAGPAARALTYPATPDLARGQYLSLRAALQAQPAPAPELLAAGDMSLRGKVWELAGRLRSVLQCAETGECGQWVFLLETPQGLTLPLRSTESLVGVDLDDPVRVLALLPAEAQAGELRLYGLVREADVNVTPSPASPPPEPAAPPPTPAAAGDSFSPPAALRQVVWDLPASADQAPAPYPNLPEVPLTQDQINRWRAWVAERNSRLSDLQLELVVRWVVAYSMVSGLDHRLAFAMIEAESDFDPSCLSHAGAMGMTQLMPVNCEDFGVTNPWNVQQNLRGGIAHLADSLRGFPGKPNYEQCILGLACYNAGSGAVRRYGGVPPYRETQAYVKKVSQKFYDLVAAGYP